PHDVVAAAADDVALGRSRAAQPIGVAEDLDRRFIDSGRHVHAGGVDADEIPLHHDVAGRTRNGLDQDAAAGRVIDDESAHPAAARGDVEHRHARTQAGAADFDHQLRVVADWLGVYAAAGLGIAVDRNDIGYVRQCAAERD